MSQQITLSQGTVAYRHTGQGYPLILLHGWGGSSRYWLGTATEFADVRTIYALDLPGFGDSPPSNTNATIDRLAELVIEFADRLHIDQFDLNGHSLGAAVAAYLAAHWPARVNRLVLSNFSIPSTCAEQYLFQQTHYQAKMTLPFWRPWFALSQPWLALWRPWIVEAWSSPPLAQMSLTRFFYNPPTNQRLITAGFHDFGRMDLRTSIESSASMGDPKLLQALKKIPVPTLLIAARQDMVTPPAGAEAAVELIPQCELAWIEECGHVPMIEQPEVYNQILREFLVPTVDVPSLDDSAAF